MSHHDSATVNSSPDWGAVYAVLAHNGECPSPLRIASGCDLARLEAQGWILRGPRGTVERNPLSARGLFGYLPWKRP